MLSISPIPAFNDNYIWLITSAEQPEQAFVVDPGDSEPVIQYLKDNNLTLGGILITHHHPDHVGGVANLLAFAGNNIPVFGPHNPKIEHITRKLKEGEQVEVLGTAFSVLEVPGHTLDHIAFYSDKISEPTLFCGDTLFAGGCGRIFEGNAAQMHASLDKLAKLPSDTQFYAAHEYTLGNLKFAKAVEPESEALQQYIEECEARRQQNIPTLPSSIGNELKINPFLRSQQESVRRAAESRSGEAISDEVEVFRVTREWKDNF